MLELEELYSSMTIEQLENVLARGGLTPDAEFLCKSQINKRAGKTVHPASRKYGGIGRVSFLIAAIVLGMMRMGASELMGFPENSTFNPIDFALIAMQLIITSLRYKNIGFNPAAAFLILIPIINIVVLFQCLFYPEGHKTKAV
jgi:hypothetical protein